MKQYPTLDKEHPKYEAFKKIFIQEYGDANDIEVIGPFDWVFYLAGYNAAKEESDGKPAPTSE